MTPVITNAMVVLTAWAAERIQISSSRPGTRWEHPASCGVSSLVHRFWPQSEPSKRARKTNEAVCASHEGWTGALRRHPRRCGCRHAQKGVSTAYSKVEEQFREECNVGVLIEDIENEASLLDRALISVQRVQRAHSDQERLCKTPRPQRKAAADWHQLVHKGLLSTRRWGFSAGPRVTACPLRTSCAEGPTCRGSFSPAARPTS